MGYAVTDVHDLGVKKLRQGSQFQQRVNEALNVMKGELRSSSGTIEHS